MAHKDEMKKLLREVEAQGWRVELRKSGHYALYGPQGQLIFAASTPSDHRAVLNVAAMLRRAGATVGGKTKKNETLSGIAQADALVRWAGRGIFG